MISILGAGAIGQLVAHKLTDASVDCQFIVRDSANFSDSWQITESEHNKTQFIPTSKASNIQPLNLVAVCVKAPQLETALASIEHRLDENSQLILFQNGMGHDAIAKKFVCEENLYFASNTHGAFLENQQHLNYAGVGAIELGSLSQAEPPNWFDGFKCSDLNASWSTKIIITLLKKLLINAVINPLTAIYQCNNGELLTDKYKSRLLTLINENQNFADSINVKFESKLKDLVFNVLEKTANNYNSMYQDVNKNVVTEINAINGFLLDLMAHNNFKAPHNWQLWSDFHISFPPLKAQATARTKEFDELQFQVTQEAGTERPFTGTYNNHSETGDYLCACCDSVLFDNKGKFDSHCGWPSFDKAKNNKAIAYREDSSHGMNRTEILCAQCGSHLGHVFDDGPTDTGIRYCVNSISLNFLKQE